MRMRSWLVSIHQRLRFSQILRRGHQHQKRSIAQSVLIERLEPRQLLTAAAVGLVESKVNTYSAGIQSVPSVAMDAAGDSVVAWASDGQDGSSYGIYAQRYDSTGKATGNEFQVNTFTQDNQYAPVVAMDAAGNFVVAWSSAGQDGSGSGIYAKRYNASGVVQGSEFLVNTYTTNSQTYPSIAMNPTGSFIIGWTSDGQDGDGAGVFAQRFNASAVPQGNEFQVNSTTISTQYDPSVAIDAAGEFVVTWSSLSDGSSYGIYGQRYSAAGSRVGGEFKVNNYTPNRQEKSSVAMDAVGHFVVAWVSAGQDGSGTGIYGQWFDTDGAPAGGEFRANTNTTGDQTNPSVSMDAGGNYVITWDSNGANDSFGIDGQRYKSNLAMDGGEFRVNAYTTGLHFLPSVAMDSTGDFVVAWMSDRDAGTFGIYSQRFVTSGPLVTGVFEELSPNLIQNGDRLRTIPSTLSVIFSDDLNVVNGGANSVTNPSNWSLARYGADVSDEIASITFGSKMIYGKNRYVAVLTFFLPLREGLYQLIARQAISDLGGRILDGESDGFVGGNFRRNFAVAKTVVLGAETRVNTYTANSQSAPKVAMNASGNYVVTWESTNQDGDGRGIFAQRYNAAGIAQGAEFQVNSYTNYDQFEPSVAIDPAGDFVIAWTSYNPDSDGAFGSQGNPLGIYAKKYSAAGAAQTGEIHVNHYILGVQDHPAVAMDATGNFVVAWESAGQDGSGYGIYAERFDSAGNTNGGLNQTLVNSYTQKSQSKPSIAMDPSGDYVIVWQDDNDQNGLGFQGGIYAQRYNSSGTAQAQNLRVNTNFGNGISQYNTSVAMDETGDFVIAWNNVYLLPQKGLTQHFFVRQFSSQGIALGSDFSFDSDSVVIDKKPSVAVNQNGDFIVAWEFDPESASASNVYARRFTSAGSKIDLEIQTNTFTTGVQRSSSVGIDANGNFVVVWSSQNQDGSGDGIYSQRYVTKVAPYLYEIESKPLNAVGSASTPLTSSVLAYDFDSDNWTGATIQISSNFRSGQDVLGFVNTATISGAWNAVTGTLTLTGTDTVSNYRNALRSVTYHNSSGSPNTTLTRTIDIQASDGLLLSNLVSRDLTVMTSISPPMLSGVGGTGTYFENDAPLALASGLTISDPNVVNLASATVSFTNWQIEDRLEFNNIYALQHTLSEDPATHTATFTINGLDTVDHYQTLLRSVVYWDVSDAPNLVTRVASFTVNDGTSNSNAVMRSTAVVAVNDPPLLTAIESSSLVYKANDPAFPPQPLSATLLVNEPDSNNLTSATVQISAGYQNDANGKDILSFTNQLGISGSFNAAAGILALSGTSAVGNYRTALRSVTFSSSGAVVSNATRALTITGIDDFLTPATSLAITRSVTVLTSNIPPGLAGIPTAPLAYARGTAAIAMAPGLFVLDIDSINLASATIQITSNYQNGQDVLAFTSGFGVVSSFDAVTGKLTLTGTTSLANYQTLLRSVTYKTNTSSANILARTISFTINDGIDSSNPVFRTVTLT